MLCFLVLNVFICYEPTALIFISLLLFNGLKSVVTKSNRGYASALIQGVCMFFQTSS